MAITSVAPSVREYADESKKQLFIVGLKARIAVEHWKGGGEPDFSFNTEHKSLLHDLFLSACDALSEKSLSIGHLKDAHAFWLSSTDDLLPRTGETSQSYEERICERQFQHAILANRLLLGE